MATIALTGATGFLGSRVLARLLETHNVIVVKRSSSNLWRIASLVDRVKFHVVDDEPISQLFAKNRIDVVVHCATNYGRGAVPPTEIVRTNLTLPLELLQLAQAHGARAFINSDTILDKRINYYSLSKAQFCEWLLLFSDRMVSVNVALEHFFGPLDDRSKFVTSVVRDLIRGVGRIALTPGMQRRDFIYVDDVVDAFEHVVAFCLEAAIGNYRFDVGSGSAMTLREFIGLAKQEVGNVSTVLDFGALPYRTNEVMDSHVDTSQLRALGWIPRVSVEDGLRRTIEGERGARD